jgi:hypothetical protein
MNPYDGTEWADIWKQGYEAGLAAPQTEISPPSPLDSDSAQVYMEGVLAGQQDGRQGGSPVTLNPPGQEEQHNPLHTATVSLGIGMLALEIAHLNPIGLAIELIVLSCELETFPQDLSDPDQLATALVGACRSKGSTELYLPFCKASDHSQTGDRVLDAGHWHGDMFLDYWGAYNAAAAHFSNEPDAVGQVGVIRVRAETSALVEWITFD